MEYTLKRQIFFGGAFFIVLIVLVFSGYYLLRPQPTCFDKTLNQQEEKVDCGGPFCGACKVVVFKDLQILPTHIFTVAENSYDVMVQVKNINTNHGIRSFSYTFHFYDAQRNKITERIGDAYIFAGQTRYIIESNIIASEPIIFTDFVINNTVRWQKQEKEFGPAALPIFAKKYKKKSLGVNFAQVTGVVENKTPYAFSAVDINIVLVDVKKQPIAVGKTQVRELVFDEKRGFTILLPRNVDAISEIYAEAVTNVFDKANMR